MDSVNVVNSRSITISSSPQVAEARIDSFIWLFVCSDTLLGSFWEIFEKLEGIRKSQSESDYHGTLRLALLLWRTKMTATFSPWKIFSVSVASCHEKKNGEYFYDENPTVICVVQKSILSDLICVSMALGNENATTGSKMLFYAILLYVLYICRTWIHQS